MSRSKTDRLPRGSNPPFLSLAGACRLVKEIYEQAGGECGLDILSKLTGNSPSSSSFIKKLNALKCYGLLQEPERNRFKLTELGYPIAAPTSLMEEALARRTAFLSVDGWARIYERHKGKLLPADEFLRNIFEQEVGIPRELSGEWVTSFANAAKAACLLHHRSDGKTQILEEPIVASIEENSSRGAENNEHKSPEAKLTEETARPSMSTIAMPDAGHTTKIELSGKRFAIFAIPDSITARDAQKLKGALTGLSAIIDSMIQEELR